MPEGDTLARIATVLRPILTGRKITSARGRFGGPRLDLVVGSTVTGVEARGKHLLIGFDNGLTLHTHLGLHGSWHRYRTGEPWRRPAARAVAILDTNEATAVCFDAPTVELVETRALATHPVLRALGTDVATSEFDIDAALAALREPRRAIRLNLLGMLATDNSSNNTFDHNDFRYNAEIDCLDESTGSGTAGTADNWSDPNLGFSDDPDGICMPSFLVP